MASARTGSIEVDNDDQPTDRRWKSARLVIGVLAGVIVVGLIVGLAGVLLPGRISYPDGSTKASREAAVAVANDFAVTYNTYDVAELEDYQDRVGGLLTEDYRTEFTQITDSIFEAIAETDQSSGDAQVRQIAVQSMDDDTAELLVAVDADLTNTDNEGIVPRTMRWIVFMARVDGEWKVDRFESIATLQAETGEPVEPGEPEAPAEPEGEEAE